MSPKRQSIVWKFFNKIDSGTVFCKLCRRNFKYNTSTSNMKAHLNSRHSHSLSNYEDREANNSVIECLEYETGEDEVLASASTSDSVVTGEEKTVVNYQKLVVPMSMRSIYWKCYGFPASADGEILTRVKIVCLLCKSVITYNRNTSNLRMHLQNKHAEDLMQLELSSPVKKMKDYNPKEKVMKTKKEIGNVYVTEADGSLVINNEGNLLAHSVSTEESVFDGMDSISTQHQTRQVKMIYNSNSNKSAKTAAAGKSQVTLMVPGVGDQNCTIESLHPFMIPIESKSVGDAIAEFIVRDMQLPDIVEGRGFQQLIASLKSPCEIPSKTRLVEEVIPRQYDSCMQAVLEMMQSNKLNMALTVDEWDSTSGENYITFSVCYQQEKDYSLCTKVLSTVHCPTVADSAYWGLVLDSLFEKWNIFVDRVRAVVSGSSRAELIDTMVNKGLVVMPCLVQTLQEVCTRVCFEQDDVREILAKCRALIYLIYKHNNALAALRIQDHLMSLDETPFTSDYPRVWISTYTMLEGLLARRQVLPTILDNIDPSCYDRDMVTLSDQDWSLIEDVISVLEPFKVTMMTLSEEKAPLVSLLKPLLWQLLCCHLKNKEDDSMNAQVFKAALTTLLSEKYTEPAVNQLLQVATTLDPRFRNLPNMADDCRVALEGPVKEALTVMIEQNPEEVKLISEEAPEKKKPRISGMAMLLGDLNPTVTSTQLSCHDRSSLEIVQYQSEPTAPLDQCPVAWWTRVSAKCPNLSRVAAQYLCVPATAIPPARLSFDAQISYDMKRANLSSETVDRLVFLNANQ